MCHLLLCYTIDSLVCHFSKQTCLRLPAECKVNLQRMNWWNLVSVTWNKNACRGYFGGKELPLNLKNKAQKKTMNWNSLLHVWPKHRFADKFWRRKQDGELLSWRATDTCHWNLLVKKRLGIHHAMRLTFSDHWGFDLSVSHLDSVARRKRKNFSKQYWSIERRDGEAGVLYCCRHETEEFPMFGLLSKRPKKKKHRLLYIFWRIQFSSCPGWFLTSWVSK